MVGRWLHELEPVNDLEKLVVLSSVSAMILFQGLLPRSALNAAVDPGRAGGVI